MKHLFTFLVLLMLVFNVNAQVSFEGAAQYGRLYNITYDQVTENKLYALSLGNHLMTSNDKGVNWDVLYTFPDQIVMLKDLKYRSDHSLSFVVDGTTYEDGVYIFDLDLQMVTNQFIAPIPSDSLRDWIQSYSVYEEDSNIAILHQSYMISGFEARARVYYTTNGGATWQDVYYNMDFDGVHPNNVAIAPNNPNKIFMLRGAGPNNSQGGLFISEDAGATWVETMANITFKPITFHPIDPNTIWLGTSMGEENQAQELFKSIDGGETWENIPVSWNSGYSNFINYIAYNPHNLDNILVLDPNEIAITNDGGSSWTNYVYPDNQPEVYSFGFYASFNPFVEDELFITADWYPMFSEDGGVTLNILPVPFHQNTMVGLAPGTDSHLYYSVQEGIVHRDFNSGETNTYYIKPIDVFSLFDPTQYFVDPNTFGRIYSFSDTFSGGFLEVSNDHGETRNIIYQSFFDQLGTLKPNSTNPYIVWISMRDAGLLSFDFSDLNQVIETSIQTPEMGLVYSIHFNPANGSEVWIGMNNTIYKSNDAGVSWEYKGNGLTIPLDEAIYDMAQNTVNPEELLAAGFNGIYRTTDDGENWEKVYSGYTVRKIKYSPLNPDHVIASVYSRDIAQAQIIISIDGGLTWQPIPVENILNSLSFSMDYYFYENTVDVYVATNDLGVIKLNIDLNQLDAPDKIASNGIRVYPNPTRDEVHVQVKEKMVKEIVIYNALGNELKKYSNEQSISLANFKTGIYLLKITTDQGIYIKRVIKE